MATLAPAPSRGHRRSSNGGGCGESREDENGFATSNGAATANGSATSNGALYLAYLRSRVYLTDDFERAIAGMSPAARGRAIRAFCSRADAPPPTSLARLRDWFGAAARPMRDYVIDGGPRATAPADEHGGGRRFSADQGQSPLDEQCRALRAMLDWRADSDEDRAAMGLLSVRAEAALLSAPLRAICVPIAGGGDTAQLRVGAGVGALPTLHYDAARARYRFVSSGNSPYLMRLARLVFGEDIARVVCAADEEFEGMPMMDVAADFRIWRADCATPPRDDAARDLGIARAWRAVALVPRVRILCAIAPGIVARSRAFVFGAALGSATAASRVIAARCALRGTDRVREAVCEDPALRSAVRGWVARLRDAAAVMRAAEESRLAVFAACNAGGISSVYLDACAARADAISRDGAQSPIEYEDDGGAPPDIHD